MTPPHRIVFASRCVGLPGGITSVINALASEFHQRGYEIAYLSLDPADASCPSEDVFVVDLHRTWTTEHPLAREHPGFLSLRLRVKSAITPVWRAWRRRRLQGYLRELGSETVLILANPDVRDILRQASYSRPPQNAPLVLEHLHTSPEALQILASDVPPPSTSSLDAVITLSPACNAPVSSHYGGIQCTTIPNPLRLSPHPPGEDLDGEQRIVFAGRLSEEKRVDRVIDAFAVLAKDDARLTLDIWGSGNCEAGLREQAQATGFGTRIRFRGWTDNPLNAFDGATLHLITSEFEGQPMSALEAAACGVPTAAFPVSEGLGEIVRRCGVPVSSPSPEDLARRCVLSSPTQTGFGVCAHVVSKSRKNTARNASWTNGRNCSGH